MEQFPQMLYRLPGSEDVHGTRMSTLIVHDVDELEAAASDGWHETSPAAIEAHRAAQVAAATPATATTASAPAPAPAPAPTPRTSKPTRDELEAAAKELDIAFDHTVSNKALTAAIEAKRAENT